MAIRLAQEAARGAGPRALKWRRRASPPGAEPRASVQDAIAALPRAADRRAGARHPRRCSTDQLRRRGLVFGDRPLATVLRPRFLTPAQYRLLQRRVRLLMRAFGKAYERGAGRPGLPRAVPAGRLGRAADPPRPGLPASRARPRGSTPSSMDEAGTMALTEYNAETPAGAGYNDVLVDVVRRPAGHAARSAGGTRRCRCRRGTACSTSLLDAYEQWAGRREPPRHRHPRLARGADLQRVRALPGVLPRAWASSAVIADPREVEYRDGRLYAGGVRVDLIYKRVLIGELVERVRARHAGRPAVRDGAVCMVNPFRCKILHKKASLAVLSRRAERAALRRRGARGHRRPHPVDAAWWRSGAPSTAARQVDLVPFVARAPRAARAQAERRLRRRGHRARLGGGRRRRGSGAVQNALGEPYVVQERVAIPSRAVSQPGGRPRRCSPTGCWTPPRSSATATTWTAA